MPEEAFHVSTTDVGLDLSARLLSLTENTSYTLTQINGQRIYKKAPNAWSGPEPSRNCEVFVGRIPHDLFEDVLVPLFRRAGELFEFRLMINFSGWNRGYAFVMYTTPEAARNAIRMFNNFMIRPAWQLGVCPSINNCRIFISRIPPTTPSAEVVLMLYALTDEVKEVRIRRSAASCAAIVEYRSHRGAAMARKALVAAASAAWGKGARPAVDWSLPQSPQMLRQYREIGSWSPDRGVELVRADEPFNASAAAGGSYTLEPMSQARRLRMITEAQRTAGLLHRSHAAQPAAAGPSFAQGSFAAQGPSAAYEGWAWQQAVWSRALSAMDLDPRATPPPAAAGDDERVWGAPGPAAPRASRDFNPWTAPHPLHGAFDRPRQSDDDEE